MSCSVAIPGSPSPRIPLCKGSPESRALASSRAAARSPSASPRAAAATPSPLRVSGGAVCGGSLLKRRRPPRIEVPPAGAESAEELAAAAFASDGPREVEEEGEGFAVYCKRGRRRHEMEDRHVAALRLRNDADTAFFGVFDGHSGHKAAQFAASNMATIMAEEMDKAGKESSKAVEAAVRIGYLRTDAEFLKEEMQGGACCVTALIDRSQLVVSNAGDCRAVLSRAGEAEALTLDHRACRDDEKERIENLGGLVLCCRGIWRVQGSLAVTRSIGDSHLKEWIIPDPDTTTLPIDPQCEFLILASDGLWEKVDNQEAVDIARPFCTSREKIETLSACKTLVDLSATRGSVDDISVMILQLQRLKQREITGS